MDCCHDERAENGMCCTLEKNKGEEEGKKGAPFAGKQRGGRGFVFPGEGYGWMVVRRAIGGATARVSKKGGGWVRGEEDNERKKERKEGKKEKKKKGRVDT